MSTKRKMVVKIEKKEGDYFDLILPTVEVPIRASRKIVEEFIQSADYEIVYNDLHLHE